MLLYAHDKYNIQAQLCVPNCLPCDMVFKISKKNKELWGGHLWYPSYYVGTAGNVSTETIQRYIERSEHIVRRR